MKSFRFLAIAILMLSVFILPVNANTIYDNPVVYIANAHTGNYNFAVHNTDTVYIIAGTAGSFAPYSNIFCIYDGTKVNGQNVIPTGQGTYPFDSPFVSGSSSSTTLSNVISNGATPYIIYNNNHYNAITYNAIIYTSQSSSTSITGTITFTYDDDYNKELESARIESYTDSYEDNTVTYTVKCKSDYPNTVYYSMIGNYRSFELGLIQYDEDETETQITMGLNGTNVYSWAYNSNNGDTMLLQTYLAGRSEIEEPTPEPTPTPTPTPDDDLSQYGDKKIFQIRNIDYSADDMLLIDGINLTIYYIDTNDNIVNKPVFKSNNAPSVFDLNVPIAGYLFVEYGITPNYEPVKIQNYPYLNRTGFLITQELSSYENLYYQYYDTDNPLTDINYGITLIDGNSHLPVSNAAISMDGGQVQYTSNYGGTVFQNITQGTHTFRVSKNGYNTLTFTKNIYITSSIEIEFYPVSVVPTATITPTPIRPEQTLTPIDKPTNIMESVSYGLAKVFGVKTVDNANYIFALLIILFPAAIAGGITHQALGFIAGGMLGFVFALTIGLIPIWTFFAMCLLAVIYIMLIRGNEGF